MRADLVGGADWQQVAADSSDDTGTKEVVGDLGTVYKGQMVPEFEEAVFSMAVDEISEPVKTTYGYHVIQVTGITEAKQFTLEDEGVKEDITTALVNEEKGKAWEKWLTETKTELGVVYREGMQLSTTTTEARPPRRRPRSLKPPPPSAATSRLPRRPPQPAPPSSSRHCFHKAGLRAFPPGARAFSLPPQKGPPGGSRPARPVGYAGDSAAGRPGYLCLLRGGLTDRARSGTSARDRRWRESERCSHHRWANARAGPRGCSVRRSLRRDRHRRSRCPGCRPCT